MEKEYFGKLEDNLKHIPDKSVRMIFADFPFNTTTAQWDKYVDLNLFWIEAWRILMDDGVII